MISKVYEGFSKGNLKVVQVSLQKNITCIYKLGKDNGKMFVSFKGYQQGCSKLV
jgi:hypothetical protein